MEEVTADDIRLALVPLSKKSEGLYRYILEVIIKRVKKPYRNYGSQMI